MCQELSPKERKVAILIAQGLKDIEISRYFDISMRRTGEIVASIKHKWDIQTRVQIGILVYHFGWIFLTDKMEVYPVESIS
nr:LuxR family transcriptional regulator [Paenibacillus zanthoxyli]